MEPRTTTGLLVGIIVLSMALQACPDSSTKSTSVRSSAGVDKAAKRCTKPQLSLRTSTSTRIPRKGGEDSPGGKEDKEDKDRARCDVGTTRPEAKLGVEKASKRGVDVGEGKMKERKVEGKKVESKSKGEREGKAKDGVKKVKESSTTADKCNRASLSSRKEHKQWDAGRGKKRTIGAVSNPASKSERVKGKPKGGEGGTEHDIGSSEMPVKRPRISGVATVLSGAKAGQEEEPSYGPYVTPDEAGQLGLTGIHFSELEPKLSIKTLRALREMGIKHCAPVQHAVIPLLLSHKDVCVEAATGSGKTLAFLIPALEILRGQKLSKHTVGSLILAPTRELASQISTVAATLCARHKAPILSLVGGSNETSSIVGFKEAGGNLVVGTPGRIREALCGERAWINCKGLQLLVLDEADRLLAMGFERAVTHILSKIPKQRRTGLFSATMDASVRNLVRAGLRNPRSITVSVATTDGSKQRTPAELENLYMFVKEQDKLTTLVALLRRPDARQGKTIVFTLTCGMVDYLARVLPKLPQLKGIDIRGLHGQMVQKRRDGTLERFEESDSSVLVCTDVAARGLDLAAVTTVIQMEPPQDVDSFIHRVGRTGRMGKEGVSFLMLTSSEKGFLELLTATQVSLREGTAPLALPDGVVESARECVKGDRAVYESSLKAVASWVRAYQLSSVPAACPLAGVNIAAFCSGIGLVHLPLMPELFKSGATVVKGRVVMDGFAPDPVAQDDIAFAEKGREKARQRRLKIIEMERWQHHAKGTKEGFLPNAPVGAPLKAGPWSKKVRKLERRRKRGKKDGVAEKVVRAVQAQVHDEEQSEDEMDQLRKDAALVKKLKRMRAGTAEEAKASKQLGVEDD